MGLGWDQFVVPGVSTPLGLVCVTLGYVALFFIIWLGILFGANVSGRLALKSTVLLHHVVVGPGALLGILTDDALREALFGCFGCQEAATMLLRDTEGPSAAASALVPITMGYMVLDLALFNYWDISGKGDRQMAMLMVGHHVLSLISWPFGLIFDFCSRYVLILVVYEVSSIFLVVKWFLTTDDKKKSTMFMVNGALFTSSFLLIRVIGALPQLRALYLAPPWTVSAAGYQLLWWMPIGSTWVILPHLLNFHWGYKVFMGSLALLRGKSEGSKEKKEQVKPQGQVEGESDAPLLGAA